MHILHYFLGFPPYRTGGLTKFAFDLMQSQKDDGNIVSAVWPGEIKFVFKNMVIKERENIKGIRNYEIINPLPVPLDEGISDINIYTKKSDIEIFKNFFLNIKPDVIHIHTLMGLYSEFVDAAKLLKIKTLFTSHDYFGICPKVTLFRNGRTCDNDNNCKSCIECNKSALSYHKIVLLQSPVYRYLKNTKIMRIIRERHRSNFFEEEREKNIEEEQPANNLSDNNIYSQLRNYYIGILSKIDVIHFNSTVTEMVYKKYFTPKRSVIITISNKEINDNNDISFIGADKLRLTYLSPCKDFKGAFLIKRVLDKLWSEGNTNFVFQAYSKGIKEEPYMKITENGFSRSDLPEIFKNTDYLLSPSLWYETFGFTVLEALSYGVPVIVTENVGAKDIVNGHGYILSGDFEEELYKVIKNDLWDIDSRKKRKQISVKTWNRFLEECYRLYDEI